MATREEKAPPGGILHVVELTPGTEMASSPSPEVALSLTTGPPLDLVYCPLEELGRRLATDLNISDPKTSRGLSTEEAQLRLKLNGPNALTPPRQTPRWLKYIHKFFGPFTLLMIAAGLASWIAFAVDTKQTANMWTGLVLFIAVWITSTFEFVTEERASDAMKAFEKMVPNTATVVRNGVRTEINSHDLVVGDVVYVHAGDQIPADIRLIFGADAKVENSSLTGESLAVAVTENAQHVTKIEKATNMVFKASQCLEGELVGVVLAVADNTVIGAIAGLVTGVKRGPTPIQKEINHFVVRLTAVAFFLGVAFIVIGLARGKNWVVAVTNSLIVCIVGVLPTGMPLAMTLCLGITARALAQRNVYVKQLSSVETLGSVTTIATDKTGTLTQNRMSASTVWIDGLPLHCGSITDVFLIHPPSVPPLLKKDKDGKFTPILSHQGTYNMLELAGILCNRATFADETLPTAEEAKEHEQNGVRLMGSTLAERRASERSLPRSFPAQDGLANLLVAAANAVPNPARQVIGDATDSALFKFFGARQHIELVRYHNRAIFELPFNSTNKFALTITKPYHLHKELEGEPEIENRRVWVKGAPEIVLNMSKTHMFQGEEKEIDEGFRENFRLGFEACASRGERVLAFATLEVKPDPNLPLMDDLYSADLKNYPTTGLCFLGLVSLVDPPKVTTPGAVVQCRRAGVRVMMVTGDSGLTAAAIARQVGIITQPTREQVARETGRPVDEVLEHEFGAYVVDGEEMGTFTQDDWDRVLLKDEVVFARTSPAQKLGIVEQLQAAGHVVAVTGDGVNDAPALKRADVGVAMGIMGTDVSKDAADVILMDDDFASIVEGIRWGRTIFDNLAKTVAYSVSHVMPELTPTLMALAFDIPQALPALAMLAIDLGTEMAPAVSYAYELPEADVMRRPPRKQNERLVTASLIFYAIVLAGGVASAFGYMVFLKVLEWHGVASDRLPWSSAYFVSGAPPFIVNGNCTDVTSSHIPKGCIALTSAQQANVLSQACGAYFYIVASSQMANLLMCKTRVVSVFKHSLSGNGPMLLALVAQAALIIIFLFVPEINKLFVGIPFTPGAYYVVILVPWAYYFLMNEGRKWWGRKYPQGYIARAINW